AGRLGRGERRERAEHGDPDGHPVLERARHGRGAEARREVNATICTQTQTRCEACSCGACARGKTPEAKRRANKRDSLALLDLIAGCIENHPREQVDRVTW